MAALDVFYNVRAFRAGARPPRLTDPRPPRGRPVAPARRAPPFAHPSLSASADPCPPQQHLCRCVARKRRTPHVPGTGTADRPARAIGRRGESDCERVPARAHTSHGPRREGVRKWEEGERWGGVGAGESLLWFPVLLAWSLPLPLTHTHTLRVPLSRRPQASSSPARSSATRS